MRAEWMARHPLYPGQHLDAYRAGMLEACDAWSSGQTPESTGCSSSWMEGSNVSCRRLRVTRPSGLRFPSRIHRGRSAP